MSTDSDELDGDTTSIASLAADPGPDMAISLREAIKAANNTANSGGPDEIRFAIPGPGVHTIRPNSELPTINDPVVIDGYSQPGSRPNTLTVGTDAVLLVELDGSAAGSESRGLMINAGQSVVRGLVINRFGHAGIYIISNGSNVVEGNYIGMDSTGAVALGNISNGLKIDNSSANVIGGSSPGARNVVSGNGDYGIVIKYVGASKNMVAGNYIGTDSSGTLDRGNGSAGLVISNDAHNNWIGTNGDGIDDVAERNVISGNTGPGVGIYGSNFNSVAGNYIGTNANGSGAIGNGLGVQIADCQGNRFGTDGNGTADTTERNVISGNLGYGMAINAGTSQSVVAGNYIGLDATGSFLLGNASAGVRLAGSHDNWIGTNGDGFGDLAERNVISGNMGGGVEMYGSQFNVVAGNFIGTDASGTGCLSNGGHGVKLTNGGQENRIGTNGDGISDTAERNVISGNVADGVAIEGLGTNLNVVAGNYIGADVNGSAALGNRYGVRIAGGAQDNRVGTNGGGDGDVAERNVVSGNRSGGVRIDGLGTNFNVVASNFIGTDVTGAGHLGNGGHGVNVRNGAQGSQICGNTIAFNGGAGVAVITAEFTPTGNRIQANAIHSHLGTDLGIELGGDGVTPNDPGDADTGPNQLQNYPLITAAFTGATTHVTGSLNSVANTTFVIDFYANKVLDPTGFGEGERWLGSTSVTTDGAGSGSFNVVLAAATGPGEFVTATATDPDGNTSEFSAPNRSPLAHIDGPDSVDEGCGITLDASGSTDPDQDPSGLTYDWDFDYTTGAFDPDHIGVTASFDALGLDGPGIRTIGLRVTDNGRLSDIAVKTVAINNAAPILTDSAFAIPENSLEGTLVGSVQGMDPGNDTLSYMIVAGSEDLAFVIDATTGMITVANSSQLDFETRESFSFEVKVDDGDGGIDTATITVDLLNQASIAGAIFVDVDQSGTYDANEPGIDGVVVELRDEQGAPILNAAGDRVTATSSNGGVYLFEDLDPGTYRLCEIQPSGVEDGSEILGSLDGSVPANDTMQLTLQRTDAYDYVFAEVGQQVASGDTAGIGFWHNKHGQALIQQGGTGLAEWLTDHFGNVFGDEFLGQDGVAVARFFNEQLFKQVGKKSAGPAKVDAQFMAVALATYFTSSNLAGAVASDYGFNVTDTGIGTRIVDIGDCGAAFNVGNDTELTIMQLLCATNDLTDMEDDISGFAQVYDQDGNGRIDSSEASMRIMANRIFTAINDSGEN